MTDFLIRNDGSGFDLVIEDGDVVFTADESRLTEVSQRVIYRLSTWRGETAYDTAAGVPYLDMVFGQQPTPGVAAILTQIILETEGVDGLVEAPSFLLSDARVLSFTAVIEVGEDSTLIEFEVAA